MKYVGLLKSGDNNSLRAYFIKSLDREVPGRSAGWVTGFIRNLSPTETLNVNFYNSSREAQTIELMPLSVVKVKNQNMDRLQLTTSDPQGFGVYEYYLSVLTSESDLESANLLTYQDIQASYEGASQFTNTKLVSYIMTSGQENELLIPVNKQLLIKNIFMEVDPTTLPEVLADYKATIALTYVFTNDEKIDNKVFPIQYFFDKRYTETFLDINWTDRLIGSEEQGASFKTSCVTLGIGYEEVSIRVWLEYVEV